jgi:hypothetical protein
LTLDASERRTGEAVKGWRLGAFMVPNCLDGRSRKKAGLDWEKLYFAKEVRLSKEWSNAEIMVM